MNKYPAAVQFSLYIAIVSFITAVTIFACYFFSGDAGFAFIGFFAALLFGVVNLIALIVLGIAVKIGAVQRKDARFALVIQLANIPVAVLLFWAGAHLLSIARITFVNETGSELQNVRILGCEERMIDQLDVGESELLWIRIPRNDCAVSIEYTQGDSIVNRNVIPYVSGFGGVYTYEINGIQAINPRNVSF